MITTEVKSLGTELEELISKARIRQSQYKYEAKLSPIKNIQVLMLESHIRGAVQALSASDPIACLISYTTLKDIEEKGLTHHDD